uniref:DDE-1 domain-containing protein n=1 Tax=Amphimedon queenslandica TaxID=400682 RepID=A0A1X7VL66_AMPQE
MSIELVAVPANMTPFFQPLDLTINGAAKKFTRNEFVTYYSSTVQKELSSGKCIEDIEVDLKLSTIKPLHAQWLINLYNFFTTTEGHAITLKGWKKAGISTLLDGTTTLGPDDPFKAIYE